MSEKLQEAPIKLVGSHFQTRVAGGSIKPERNPRSTTDKRPSARSVRQRKESDLLFMKRGCRPLRGLGPLYSWAWGFAPLHPKALCWRRASRAQTKLLAGLIRTSFSLSCFRRWIPRQV